MIITHASNAKIESVQSNPVYSLCLKGCLCFADEGNTYNLVNECNYQYNLEVDEDNIINVNHFWYEHEPSEAAAQEVFEMMRDDIFGWDDCTDEELAELLDRSVEINDVGSTVTHDEDSGWAVQQYQGILAHKLGYDCAKDFDEQGVVYVAYCVGRELQEVKK